MYLLLEAIPPRDCSEVDNTISGVYQVSPDGGEPVSVYCDFVTKHGPWTVSSSFSLLLSGTILQLSAQSQHTAV